MEARPDGTLLFQPRCLRSHVKPEVGIHAKMALGYRSRYSPTQQITTNAREPRHEQDVTLRLCKGCESLKK